MDQPIVSVLKIISPDYFVPSLYKISSIFMLLCSSVWLIVCFSSTETRKKSFFCSVDEKTDNQRHWMHIATWRSILEDNNYLANEYIANLLDCLTKGRLIFYTCHPISTTRVYGGAYFNDLGAKIKRIGTRKKKHINTELLQHCKIWTKNPLRGRSLDLQANFFFVWMN